MNSNQLLQHAIAHLESLGIEVEFTQAAAIELAEIKAFEAELGFRLPADLAEFYTSCSNGFTMAWEDTPQGVWGNAYLPELQELRLLRQRWCTDQLGFTHYHQVSFEQCNAPNLYHWLPLIEEENGDQICVDCQHQTVTYWSHESGDDLVTLEASFTIWLDQRARHCFQIPPDLYWPSIANGRGVDWSSDEFDSKYVWG
ncbi:SMI1/KNR4 family protein [Aeoliella mucimassa]|uniref:SMI1 / KNR4 family protein n=1 Tax=Aeoliella mucimassa TaxID=2527972 RepID=A0A518AVV8_9BACT|nr:SMI1/KNR4 family protein [Aeoliella mucimassa]QDU58842.1 SMI1 / KNR4 family protein [Aeoliella mucimassa]